MVDVSELWLPTGRDVLHSEWLTKLVITLLSSGGVSEEVLVLIRPVCKVKVHGVLRWEWLLKVVVFCRLRCVRKYSH